MKDGLMGGVRTDTGVNAHVDVKVFNGLNLSNSLLEAPRRNAKKGNLPPAT
jgi:hypothetical protein